MAKGLIMPGLEDRILARALREIDGRELKLAAPTTSTERAPRPKTGMRAAIHNWCLIGEAERDGRKL
jgi:hypothetical protein